MAWMSRCAPGVCRITSTQSASVGADTAIRLGVPLYFLGVERGLIELDRVVGIADDEVRAHRAKAHGLVRRSCGP